MVDDHLVSFVPMMLEGMVLA